MEQNVFRFLDNCIWIGSGRFSQFRKENLSLTVSVLTNAPKISHITKGDICWISFTHSGRELWWNCCHTDFTGVCNPLTCWLSKDILKQGFLDISLTTSLAVLNSGNILVMTVIVFSKCLKFELVLRNGSKNWGKVFRFLDNCIWVVSRKFSEFEDDNCHRHSMC